VRHEQVAPLTAWKKAEKHAFRFHNGELFPAKMSKPPHVVWPRRVPEGAQGSNNRKVNAAPAFPAAGLAVSVCEDRVGTVPKHRDAEARAPVEKPE